jgi:deferrochelatase/peroxidase EfeB
MAAPTVALDLENIQGAVLRGYRLPVARYLFLGVSAPARARAFIGEIAEEVSSAAPWSQKPDSALNVYLTFAGLSALGLPESALASFPADFRTGMAARAQLLGDTGESAPERWEAGLGGPRVHVMLMLSSADERVGEKRRRSLLGQIERAGGLKLLGEQRGSALAGNREHFGYADGFSQPPVEGFAEDRPRPGGGAPRKDGRWRAIRTGEFVLGYPDEEGVLPPAPGPEVLGRDGSYLVYRKLAQDVAGFRTMLERASAIYPGGKELLAAKLVGRFRDGTPLDRSQRLPLRLRSAGPSLPGRGPRAARQPAREHAVSGEAREPPPSPAPGHHLRPAAPRGLARGRAGTRRPLHVLSGEHQAPVRVRPGPVVQRRQRLSPRRRQGRAARRP